jgi:hypothetical protein
LEEDGDLSVSIRWVRNCRGWRTNIPLSLRVKYPFLILSIKIESGLERGTFSYIILLKIKNRKELLLVLRAWFGF